MKKKEAVFYGGLSILCAGYLIYSMQMPFGSLRKPGQGFIPVILGVMGIIISLWLLLNCIRVKEKSHIENEEITKKGLLRFLGYVTSIIAYILFSEIIGTYISIFVLVLFLTKISGLKGWGRPIIIAAACAVTFYLLFAVALAVPLPNGFLEDIINS